MEANAYAINNLEYGRKTATVLSAMNHLRDYAEFLERETLDWRHFPLKKKERCLFRYRGHLIDRRDEGGLSPSTATARMSAVVQFYRWALSVGLIENRNLWKDTPRIVRCYSTEGLKRTFAVSSSELSIPNRSRLGMTLEGGLLPLSDESAHTLLGFLHQQEMSELYWMFLIGFSTGARSETIRTLRISTLEAARPDPSNPNVMRVPVGPPHCSQDEV